MRQEGQSQPTDGLTEQAERIVETVMADPEFAEAYTKLNKASRRSSWARMILLETTAMGAGFGLSMYPSVMEDVAQGRIVHAGAKVGALLTAEGLAVTNNWLSKRRFKNILGETIATGRSLVTQIRNKPAEHN